MSVDGSAEMQPPSSQNGGTAEVHVDGLSNDPSGSSSKHHISSSKDKHRDKDKDRDPHKSSSSSSHKSSSSDKENHSSPFSSGQDKHRDIERDVIYSSSSKFNRSEKDQNEKDQSDKDRSDNKDRSDKDRSDKDQSEKDRSEKDRSEKDRSETDLSDKDRRDNKDRSEKDGSEKDGSEKDQSERDQSEKDLSEKDMNKIDQSDNKDRSEKDGIEKDGSEKDLSEKDLNEIDQSGKDRSDKDRNDKDRSDKDRIDRGKRKSSSSSAHKSSSKDKERRDKDKDHSSSSSSKGKDRHHKPNSSSSSSRDKDRERDKDRHHKSSSSSKRKHSSSSSSAKCSSHHHLKQLETAPDGKFIKPEPLTQSQQNFYDNSEILAKYIKLEEIKKEPLSMEEIKKQKIKQKYFTPDPLDNSFEENYESLVKLSFQDISQTSSCDYSMSQFIDDELEFVAKEEASYQDDSSFNEDEDVSLQADEDEEDEDEDMPLATRSNDSKHHREIVIELDDDDEDGPLSKLKLTADEDVPLLARKKIKKDAKTMEKEKKQNKDSGEGDYTDLKPNKKTKRPASSSVDTEAVCPSKRMRKEKNDEEDEVWRWWEEEKREDGIKWSSLEHKGPVFAPLYERLPKNVRFFYNGKPMHLSEETEEAATFYAKMLDHDYCSKPVFNDNFFKDFRQSMTTEEKAAIRVFEKCNFEEIHQYFLAESEKRKNASKEEKLRKKEENEAIIREYGVCLVDGHKEKIGNFRLEPPGLFRGRGEHPKMGRIKRRIRAEDISINCSKDSKIPQPPHGQRWREVIHNNTVTWLASWTDNIQGQVKYIMLNPSSKLKGEKDHVKYETARRLAKSIDSIRNTYRSEWKSKEMGVRQRAVALYFIDKLALRAGNEKDEDQADTVGCCSLRVEHVSLHKQFSDKENVVVFDFLGKDSIRYYNEVEVEKRVFKNLELFMENKRRGDDLFDRLNTLVLNEHLKELMDGLTAKVFRTYNASVTLQNQLDSLTEDDMTIPEKLLAYNRANRAVAILCNHQRSVPKSHEKSMENLKEKIRQKRELIDEGESKFMDLRRAAKRGSVKEKLMADKKGKQLERLKEQLQKLELQETDRDENKTIALGTSKLNYLDPRISVAWCKKNGVPIEKIFNKAQRNKFMWAIHMADENYRF